MFGSKSTFKAAVLIRMIEVIVRIVAARVMAYPHSSVIDVGRIGVTRLVHIVTAFLVLMLLFRLLLVLCLLLVLRFLMLALLVLLLALGILMLLLLHLILMLLILLLLMGSALICLVSAVIRLRTALRDRLLRCSLVLLFVLMLLSLLSKCRRCNTQKGCQRKVNRFHNIFLLHPLEEHRLHGGVRRGCNHLTHTLRCNPASQRKLPSIRGRTTSQCRQMLRLQEDINC